MYKSSEYQMFCHSTTVAYVVTLKGYDEVHIDAVNRSFCNIP